MTKVAILISSHINYKGQLNFLDNCIKSLLVQTMIPKSIYISISFENESYKTEFKTILKKYGEILNPKIIFKISNEKKYQMEHLHNITSNIDVNNYDMLMFCDDDDTYHIQRIEMFVSAFNSGKIMHPEKFSGVRERIILENGFNTYSEFPEYWCYGIVPNAIIDFFNLFNNDLILLKHNFGDMYFRHYLSKSKKYYTWIGILDEKIGFTLYNYNIDNPNSICGKIENGIGNKFDNLIIKVLNCNYDNDFHNMIKDNEIKYNINKKDFIVLKYIFDFSKTLYKKHDT